MENTKILNEWFEKPDEQQPKWLVLYQPPRREAALTFKDRLLQGVVSWVKDTAKSSIADRVSYFIVGGGAGNWVVGFVLKQYILSYVI